MKIVRPVTITSSNLTSSNTAEDDYGVWSGATTYAAGDYAISTVTHTVYRSLTADNLDNDPDAEQVALADPLIADPSPINWQVIGATDRYKPFDGRPSRRVTQADSIAVTLTPGVFIGSVAGFGISAASVTVTMVDDSVTVFTRTIAMQDEGVVVDWFSYFFEPIVELSEFAFSDLPPYSNAATTITVARTGGNVSVGQLVIGPVWDAGVAVFGGTGFSGLDFSFVETNVFGDLITVTREATRLSDFEILLGSSKLLSFDSRMRSLRGGVAAVWIADEDSTKAAINFGFYRDYRTVYQTIDYSIINVQVQGIV